MACSHSRPFTANEPRLGLALLIGLVVLVAAGKPILFDTLDPDCFWHLRVAEQLRHEGIGPLVDRLSFASMQKPWTPYSWLAELGMEGIWRAGGWRLALGAQSILQAAFITLIALACRARPVHVNPHAYSHNRRYIGQKAHAACSLGLPAPNDRSRSHGTLQHQHQGFMTDPTVPGALESAVAVAVAAFLSLSYLSFRPVTAALVLLALCGWLLVRDRRSGEQSAAVWFVVPLTALLVNIHLYAVLIPVWVAALFLGAMLERRHAAPEDRMEAQRRVTRYGWLLVGTAAGCLMTPMLPGVIGSALHYQASDPMVAGGMISEMKPFYHGVAGNISAGLVLVIAGCALLGRKKLRAGEWIWFTVATLFLLRLGRFAPAFAIVAGPIFAATLPSLSSRVLARRPVCALMAMVLAGGVLRLCSEFPRSTVKLETWLNRHGPDTPGYPCAAADYVAAHVTPNRGRLINEFTWGGYLEWRLGNRYQTLLDGRTQLFTTAFWNATYLGGDDQRASYLSRVKADVAVLPIERSLFQQTLLKQGWHVAYQDDRAQVLLPPSNLAKDATCKWPFASLLFDE